MSKCQASGEEPGTVFRCTAARLGESRSMTYDVRAGDMLYSVSGHVWGTVDGQLEDVIVSEDSPYTVPRDATMRFVAIGGPATLNITSREASVRAGQRPARHWSRRLARHLSGALLRPPLRQPV